MHQSVFTEQPPHTHMKSIYERHLRGLNIHLNGGDDNMFKKIKK